MKKLHWYMMGKIADSKSMKKIRREAFMVIFLFTSSSSHAAQLGTSECNELLLNSVGGLVERDRIFELSWRFRPFVRFIPLRWSHIFHLAALRLDRQKYRSQGGYLFKA